jgi:hypothetical protein
LVYNSLAAEGAGPVMAGAEVQSKPAAPAPFFRVPLAAPDPNRCRASGATRRDPSRSQRDHAALARLRL